MRGRTVDEGREGLHGASAIEGDASLFVERGKMIKGKSRSYFAPFFIPLFEPLPLTFIRALHWVLLWHLTKDP